MRQKSIVDMILKVKVVEHLQEHKSLFEDTKQMHLYELRLNCHEGGEHKQK